MRAARYLSLIKDSLPNLCFVHLKPWNLGVVVRLSFFFIIRIKWMVSIDAEFQEELGLTCANT